MFESLERAPADPILGLNEAFQQDPHPAKINLSVGVFTDENGVTPVLETVKQAERRLLQTETTKSYLPIAGSPRYGNLVQEMLLGKEHPLIDAGRIVTLQTPGGTGALRVGADFLKQHFPQSSVWCSRPTWANHPTIFQAAGVSVREYAYLDAQARALDFDAMLESFDQMPAGDVVVLHVCCHNPSGIDPTPQQWKTIAERIAERRLMPLLDFAYQGFGEGLEPDATGLRTMLETVDELLVASSFSKNFGLYRERVGALSAVTTDADSASKVFSNLKINVRTNYSNPPSHGALIVETILEDAPLRAAWADEVSAMRQRIQQMRTRFVERMQEHAPNHDFSFLLPQKGMFSFSGLSAAQVDRLRQEHSIYIVRSGRINVAAITSDNLDRLCRAVASVLD